MVGSDVAAALRVFRDSPREITLCHQMTAVLNSAKTPCEATCSAPGTSGHRSWKDLAVSVTVTTIGINFRSRCSMAVCFPPLSLTTFQATSHPGCTCPLPCTDAHMQTQTCTEMTHTHLYTHTHKNTLVDTCIHKTYNMGRHAQTCRNRYTCTKTQIHNTQDNTLTQTPLCTQ